MIDISSCPITGLRRRLEYDFYWLQSEEKIVINCRVHHYTQDDVLVQNARIVSYWKALTASDSLVDPIDGHLLAEGENEPAPVTEYYFYTQILGLRPIVLPSIIEGLIAQRDAEGKFNI